MGMKTVSLLLLASFSLQAISAPANEAKSFKKQVSKIVYAIKKSDDVKKKEVVLEKLVDVLNQGLDNAAQSSPEASEEAMILKEKLAHGLDSVKGGSAEEMDEFASFIESEMNQASPVIIVGIMLLVVLIPVWLSLVMDGVFYLLGAGYDHK